MTHGCADRESLRPHQEKDLKNERIKRVIAGAGKVSEGGSSSSTDKQESKNEYVCQPCGVDYDEDECIEQAPIIVIKDPGAPTAEEKAVHDVLHLPHRSWCPICVKARGKEDPHFKKSKNKPVQSKPVISFDYKSYGQEIDRDDKLTALIIRDVTKTIYSHVCNNKGASDEWIIDQILQDIEDLGHIEVI